MLCPAALLFVYPSGVGIASAMASLGFRERHDAAKARIIPLTAEGRLDSSAEEMHNIAMRFCAAFQICR
jgi:hypothetical protein